MKLALFGDIHHFFDDKDVQYFNNSDFDFLIFTGDLPDFFHLRKKIYKVLRKLKKKSYLIWGNHDGFSFLEVVGEIFKKNFLRVKEKDFNKIETRLKRLQNELGENFVCGGFQIEKLNDSLALFLVRPHSIGGDSIAYKEYLKKKYIIYDLESSFLKMKKLLHEYLEKNTLRTLIFLGHNGPHGLGNLPYDLWGCDFNPQLGDFGDKDYTKIIQYAQSLNIQIPLVIGGHMHHKLSKQIKEQRERKSIAKLNNTYYINPAKVPRISKNLRYFVSVEFLSDTSVKVQEMNLGNEL
ncbi:MAG: metallophosphoesterase [Leptonema sp. (in: bacteria)]